MSIALQKRWKNAKIPKLESLSVDIEQVQIEGEADKIIYKITHTEHYSAYLFYFSCYQHSTYIFDLCLFATAVLSWLSMIDTMLVSLSTLLTVAQCLLSLHFLCWIELSLCRFSSRCSSATFLNPLPFMSILGISTRTSPLVIFISVWSYLVHCLSCLG
jgi:hypothetical protein